MKTNKERSALTREIILKKAMKLFVLNGYYNTSLRDIAKESAKAILRVFKKVFLSILFCLYPSNPQHRLKCY